MLYEIFPLPILIMFIFVFGTTIGSFLNVLIDRLPQEHSILGRSHCDRCNHKLSPLDLIPLFSFMFLKGRCKYCKNSISFVIFTVELITGVSFVLSYLYLNVSLETLIMYWGIISCCIAIFGADVKYHIIPDSLQFALFIFATGYIISSGAPLELLLQHALSGMYVMLPILMLFVVTRGRGMGFGDVKLSFTIGYLLGTLGGFLALYIGFTLGAIIGTILLVSQYKKLKSAIAFGPFLILGMLILLFWGNLITEQVAKWYNFS